MIRVLIAEDSAVQREFLSIILEESGEFEVAGTAVDGEDAARQAERLRPDVILMDCHMPRLDGMGATRLIMEATPTPIVIASASSANDDVKLAFDAIKNGALAVVNKPPAFGSPNHDLVAAHLLRTLRLMAEVKVVRRWPARTRREDTLKARAMEPHQTVEVVVLVGSTGAPEVIADLLGFLSGTHATVLIVQHMSPGFIEGYAVWLASRTGLTVEMARHGVRPKPGHAYVAPDQNQMGIDASGAIVLSAEAEDDGFRPSGTFLLRSVARVFGRRALGVVLTGMGRDGAAGLLELKDAGGLTVAQSEESCVVFGMPGEAVRLGAAMHVLAPEEIARLITTCTGNQRS